MGLAIAAGALELVVAVEPVVIVDAGRPAGAGGFVFDAPVVVRAGSRTMTAWCRPRRAGAEALGQLRPRAIQAAFTTSDQALKAASPMFQIKVYDAERKRSEKIELAAAQR